MAVTGVVCGPGGSAVAAAVAEVAALLSRGDDAAASWALVAVVSVAALVSGTDCGELLMLESTGRCATSGKAGGRLRRVFGDFIAASFGAAGAGVAARDCDAGRATMLRVIKL